MSQIIETKPAIQSSVLWALTGIAVPYLGEVFTYLGQLPPGVLPKPIGLAITGVSLLLAIYKRLYSENKMIKGLITPQGSELK